MNAYDMVKKQLEDHAELRDSDKKLMWSVWDLQVGLERGYLTSGQFIAKCISPETITRARRKVQEQHPHLRPTDEVVAKRRGRESKQGNFIFDEDYIK